MISPFCRTAAPSCDEALLAPTAVLVAAVETVIVPVAAFEIVAV
ncbi:MAG: hypothetical protein ACK4F2_07735 [Novosphingobium meiothermophilum]